MAPKVKVAAKTDAEVGLASKFELLRKKKEEKAAKQKAAADAAAATPSGGGTASAGAAGAGAGYGGGGAGAGAADDGMEAPAAKELAAAPSFPKAAVADAGRLKLPGQLMAPKPMGGAIAKPLPKTDNRLPAARVPMPAALAASAVAPTPAGGGASTDGGGALSALERTKLILAKEAGAHTRSLFSST
jgi:hypothetical protein